MLGEIKTLLQSSRLVTMTGPGGTGKTRLSLQVAESLAEDYPDGIFFLALAPVREVEMVLPVIAKTIEIVENPSRSVQENLEAYLEDKHVLLVLDNFEQVVRAAPLISGLLQYCTRMRILVTSRITLHVPGEQEYPVQPLTLPDAEHLVGTETLSGYPSIELFVDRAQKSRPRFELTQDNALEVAEICRRLDGLPLAIELAAARMKIFSPRMLLQRLGKALDLLKGSGTEHPERQLTLRNTIRWSYDLLEPAHQHLFRRLSVFIGGATMEVIEAVGTAETEQIILRVGNNWSVTFSPLIRSLLLIKSGQLEEANKLFEEGFKTSYYLENPAFGPLLFAYYCRGMLALARKEFKLAREYLLTSFRLRLKYRDIIGIAETLEAMAGPPRSVKTHEKVVVRLQTVLDQKSFEAAFAKGAFLKPEQAYELISKERKE